MTEASATLPGRSLYIHWPMRKAMGMLQAIVKIPQALSLSAFTTARLRPARATMMMKKMAAMAEAHYILMAPHDGSLGPVGEMAAIHLDATLPNFLIQERLEDDVPQRYEVMQPQPKVVDSYIAVPDAPGLGVDIVEEAIAKYPSVGNISPPDPKEEYVYFRARERRARWLSK